MSRWAGGLLVCALALALRAPVADLPLERDEGGYAYIAWRWLEGELPYRDAFDQKPPGIFLFYALPIAIAGSSAAAIRWAAQLWTLVTLVGLVALGGRVASRSAAWCAAVLAALLTVDSGLLGNAVNAETLALAPLTVGALTAWRARAGPAWADLFATGLLGGVALLMKPVVAPVVLYLGLTAVWGRPRLVPRLFAMGVAGALPILAVAGGFAAAGGWRPFWDATVANNLLYAGGTPLAEYPRYFAGQLRSSLPTLGPVYALALLAWPALRLEPDVRGETRFGWILGWLGASFLAVSAGGYFRPHYFLLAAPPLVLLAGTTLAAAGRLLVPRRAELASVALAVAVVGNAVVQGWWYYAPDPDRATRKLHRIYGSNPFPESPALARWLAEQSSPDDTIFVYGSEPQLLFGAQRRSASRYIYVYPLNMPAGRPLERQREVLAELDASPPRFVVGCFLRTSQLVQPGTPPDLRAGLRERIERDYRVAAVVPFAGDRSTRIVEGRAARTMWRERPLWDGATPWAAFVVWGKHPAEP